MTDRGAPQKSQLIVTLLEGYGMPELYQKAKPQVKTIMGFRCASEGDAATVLRRLADDLERIDGDSPIREIHLHSNRDKRDRWAISFVGGADWSREFGRHVRFFDFTEFDEIPARLEEWRSLSDRERASRLFLPWVVESMFGDGDE